MHPCVPDPLPSCNWKNLVINRTLWATYGAALFLAGEYSQAKPVCERVLDAIKNDSVAHGTTTIVIAHVQMSFILKVLDVEAEAQYE